jgi:hypothetical protein
MIAYLMDYRNPFVSIQLLPNFLEPNEYEYTPYIEQELSLDTHHDDETRKSQVNLIRGKADVDGGSFPTWDQTFSFVYKPPKLTNCKVVSTEG